MKSDLSTDRDYELWALISRTRDMIMNARAKELKESGISTREAAALYIIQALDAPATPAEISRWIFRRHHSVLGLINRMEKRGFVKTSKDLHRKNLIRVSLTEKGQHALDLSSKVDSLRRIFSPLSEEQRQQLRSCLEMVFFKGQEEIGMKKHPFLPPPRA